MLGPWSRDGQRVAVNLVNSQGVVEAGVASGSTRTLAPAPFYADDWSPDGQFVFSRDVNGDRWSLIRLTGASGSRRFRTFPGGGRN